MRSILLLLGILSASGASLAGCATEDAAPSTAPAALTVNIRGADGTTQTASGAWEDVFPSGYGALPTFTVDGRPSTDPADVLNAQRVELMRPDGTRLVLGRVEGRLTMIDGPMDVAGREVRARFSGSSMFLSAGGAETEVRLTAANEARLRSYLGRCAIDALGGHAGLAGVEQGREVVTVTVALLTLGVVSVAACIASQALCQQAAERQCRGRSGRTCFRQSCIVGVDFRGRVHFGPQCFIKCGSSNC